jgi:predicted site-specific integrase-resolvase
MLRMPNDECSSPDELLTTLQVAEILGRSIATVNRYALAGQLPVAAQANGRLYRRRDVDLLAAADRAAFAAMIKERA